MGKRYLVLPDAHLDMSLPGPYQVVKKFIPSFKPDGIILLGDWMDCAALSHWNQDKKRQIEGKRWRKECDFAKREMDFLQRHTNEIIYIEGNHENWVEQYIDKNPSAEGFFEIPIALKLKERGVKWVAQDKLYKRGHVYFCHGHYVNKYHANKHLVEFGCNIVYGHTHRPQTDSHNMKMQEPYMAYGLGCLCNHAPAYLKGKHAKWVDQFAIVEEGKGTFNVYPVNIIKGRFVLNGKEWRV